jgi:hypothetical protein
MIPDVAGRDVTILHLPAAVPVPGLGSSALARLVRAKRQSFRSGRAADQNSTGSITLEADSLAAVRRIEL